MQGLRRYGFSEAADRIAIKFLSLVRDRVPEERDYRREIRCRSRTAEVSGGIRFGYRSNETGFGWTNAVFAALFDELDPSKRELLRVNPAAATFLR